ncbi:hypothetical protein N9L68_05710 [bacterium]|nr:hypothetical protein [bacterium]
MQSGAARWIPNVQGRSKHAGAAQRLRVSRRAALVRGDWEAVRQKGA